ncbi:UvrABC system protein C [Deltaproteobacteria bacterium]|nr:UvrABC system protein C [Deltaproteobacteria bacterium]
MQLTHHETISTAPGVYLFSNDKEAVIYVGKAKNLRKRVLSYFRDPENIPPKTRAMLSRAASLKTIVTKTEKEALLLEASLIKKFRPRYNIVLRDDKDYILFRLDTNAPFPRLEIVRRIRPDRRNARTFLFGPYSSAMAARETWRAIHKLFPLRRCANKSFANRSRPCLYHHMEQCLAPCIPGADKAHYAAVVEQVLLLLRGKSGELLHSLQNDMQRAADALDFEQAAILRDRIRAVTQTVERQSVVLDKNQDMDVLGMAAGETGLALCILFVRGGILLDRRTYFWPELSLDDTPDLLESFLVQFYQTGLPVPPKIIIPWFGASTEFADGGSRQGEEQETALAEALADIRGGSVHLLLPRNGAEEALVALASANAGATRRQPDAVPMSHLLEKSLRASRPIERIEAVDVSHTGGKDTRVGMVVFENEHPDKSSYRAYAMDAGGDDYAALYTWAKRRAARGEPWPDLLLIDGGRGQISAVLRAFQEAGIAESFSLAGIAKARTEDGRADRRAGNDADRIFLPERVNPLPIAPGSPELFFLQHVRDTAHDFAIGRHRKARSSRALAGELLRIPGVGPKTAKLLWKRFTSLADMVKADESAIASIPGIGPALAKKIIAHCRALQIPEKKEN